VTFHRPFDRSSIASNTHSNAPANGRSIACHHPSIAGVPSPHTPAAMERAAPLVLRRRSQSLDAIWMWAARGTDWLTSAGSDGQIKRTAVRRLPSVAKVCLHIGFCKFSRGQNSAVQGVHVPPFSLSQLNSIFRAMALAMCAEEESRCLFAIVRVDAT
jgi:hypothetical protein